MIRQCLELGLHRQLRTDEKSPYANEFKKRLFWSIHHLERRIALVLGRPLAISDDEIDIGLPQYVEDDDSGETTESLDENQPSNSNNLRESPQGKVQNDIWFHVSLIKLDQLNAKSRLTLCRLAKASPEARVYKIAKRFQELEDWKTAIFGSVPSEASRRASTQLILSTPRTTVQTPMSRPALSETQRLALLLNYHRARRMLLQTILTDVHLPDQSFPYASFAKSSGEVCQLNRRLHRLKPVPFTLLDLHSVFVAGFSMIYCAWNDPQLYDTEMAADFGACSTVLYLIADQWGPGAKRYRDAFELVAEKTAEHVSNMRRARESGQQQNDPLDPQAHAGGIRMAPPGQIAHGIQAQSNSYVSERNGAEGWANDNIDVWQRLTQCVQPHECTDECDTLDFTGIEAFLAEEVLDGSMEAQLLIEFRLDCK
jgi:hypothetical protein